jgi:hypothetical protein
VCTPACLLAASISVEAVTPPLVGLAIKNYFQTIPFDVSSTREDLKPSIAWRRNSYVNVCLAMLLLKINANAILSVVVF